MVRISEPDFFESYWTKNVQFLALLIDKPFFNIPKFAWFRGIKHTPTQ